MSTDALARPSEPLARPIKEIELPTRNEFAKLRRDEPFLIKRAVPNWTATRTWSHGWFKQHYGDRRVWVERGDDFLHFDIENITIREFVGRTVEQNPPEQLYLTEGHVFALFPELTDHIDLDRPDLFNQVLMSPPKIYMGPAGSFSSIHYDHAPNLTAQVYGRKRWVFYTPDQTDLLYPYPRHHFLSHFSKINTLEKLVDFDSFPLFKRAEQREAIVEPGDIIYVPVGWWHHVTSLDPTISLHFFSKTWPQYLAQVVQKPLFRLLGKAHSSEVVIDWRKLKAVRRLRSMYGIVDGAEGRELAEIAQRRKRARERAQRTS
jgi:hypothetical protein